MAVYNLPFKWPRSKIDPFPPTSYIIYILYDTVEAEGSSVNGCFQVGIFLEKQDTGKSGGDANLFPRPVGSTISVA
jgi:hypothetical protein